MKFMKGLTAMLATLAFSAVAVAGTLDEVKERGYIKAGVNGGV